VIKNKPIPLFLPKISSKDKKVIDESLNSNILSGGPKTKKFESEFTHYTKSKFSVSVSSATAALHLSLLSLGIGKNDEVIIPDITFVATANAVLLVNATPVLADVDYSMNISSESIESKITKKTKAIIPVHFGGLSCNMKKIRKIAKEHNLRIIEDCAHAIGAKYDKKHVGTIGDIGCFSFFATKNMTTFEGGMIITNLKKVAIKTAELRSHGITRNVSERYKTKSPWNYDVITPGYNYKMDEIRATLGSSQLSGLDHQIKKRRKIAKFYIKNLENIEGIEVINKDKVDENVFHLFLIRIKNSFRIPRDKVHLKLKEQNIQTTVHYRPLHQFSIFKKQKLTNKQFPCATEVYNECLSLPMFPDMRESQQMTVIKELEKIRNQS